MSNHLWTQTGGILLALVAAANAEPPPPMAYLVDNIMEPAAIRDTAARLRALGITAIQTYVTWESCEREAENAWDWSRWDETVDLLAQHNLDWVPFLIAGPAYATPGWFREGPYHVSCRCLEHGEDSKIQSLWNPHFPWWVQRFLSAFAERYGGHERLQAVNPGIQGDYGEAIYSVTGDWTQHIPGSYHNHEGFWCGDPHALEDFRAWAREKYRHIHLLNAAWETEFTDFADVAYPGRGEELAAFRAALPDASGGARRRWLDFVDWYRGAMTRFADWWLGVAREAFPNLPVYLCTGGHAPPEHGAHFAEQSRVAAAHAAGVRITNEGSDFAGNFVMTRLVASACRHYGAAFGFEPAQFEDELGILARVFNAATSGASHLTDKDYNLLDGHLDTMPPSRFPELPTRAEAVKHARPFLFRAPRPRIHAAVWHPDTSLMLEGKGFAQVAAVRDFRFFTDHDYVDETLLRAGALDRYAALVILYGNVMERTDALRIARWVERGGVLIVALQDGLVDVSRDNAPEGLLFGDAPEGRPLGQGRVLRVPSLDLAAETLNGVFEARGLPVVRPESGHAFAAQVDEGRWLLLNMEGEPATVSISVAGASGACVVPPRAIRKFAL